MSANFATEGQSKSATTEGEVAYLQGFRMSIRGKPSAAVDWKACKKIVKKKDYIKFSRTPAVAAAYEVTAAKDLQRFATIGDEVNVRLFGALELEDPKSGKTIAAQIAANETALVLMLNRFPYTVTNEVKHYVLWTRGQLDGFKSKDVRRIVSANLGIGKKHVLAFQQPEGFNSVPNVSHWQVFVEAKALPSGLGDQPRVISNTALSTKVAKIEKNKRIGRMALFIGLAGGAFGAGNHIVHPMGQ